MPQTANDQLNLAKVFHEQLESYQQALVIIEQIEKKFTTRTDAQTDLESLNEIMTRVAAQDDEVRELRELVFAVPESLSVEIRDVSAKLKSTVELMLGRVQEVETIAREIRDGLRPQVSEHVAARQMVNAYKPT